MITQTMNEDSHWLQTAQSTTAHYVTHYQLSTQLNSSSLKWTCSQKAEKRYRRVERQIRRRTESTK